MTDNLLIRWIIVLLVLTAAGLAIAFNWGADGPLNLGIDLRGGYSITYSISPKSIAEVKKAGGNVKEALADTITVISTRLNGLGLREMTIRQEGQDRIVIQAPALTKTEVNKIKERMVQLGKLEFAIGLGDLQQDKKGSAISVPGPEEGTIQQYRFNQDQAEKQRQEAIKKGTGGYRDGTPYRLKAQDGRDLPIVWIPWTPSSTRYAGKGISENDARTALNEARVGHPHTKEHILGSWVYYDPDYWGSDLEGFTGHDIGNVKRSADNTGSRTVVYSVKRDRQAEFAAYTRKYTGWPMVLALNDELWSAPIIQTELSDNVSINGGSRGFSKEDQDFLVTALQSGSLKLRPREESETRIAASLGTDAVNRGVWASISGLILVVLIGLWYYRFGGVVANVALMLNMLLLISILALFQATLTLPGIAGIILTIGMAVDANILIYERIREELAKGKTLVASMQAGYARAFITIIDANLTTFFTAVILYQEGVGPIKGFAVTLMAGIVCSLFTAVFVTRAVFGFLLKRDLIKSFKMRAFVRPDIAIGFLDKRRLAVTASVSLMALSLVAFFMVGDSKYGLDFTGGTVARLNFQKPVTTTDIKTRLAGVKDIKGNQKYTEINPVGLMDSAQAGGRFKAMEVQVQSHRKIDAQMVKSFVEKDLKRLFGDRLYQVNTPTRERADSDWQAAFSLKQDDTRSNVSSLLDHYTTQDGRKLFNPMDRSALDSHLNEETGEILAKEFVLGVPDSMLGSQDVVRDMRKVLGGILAPKKPFEKVDYVGPNVVSNLKQQAIVAIILSLIVTILYIWFRFKELKYGFAAALAVFHDVIIALGIVVACNATGLVHVPLTLSIIAGFLTIIGYSLNDTIVLFDRVRENLGNVQGSYMSVIDLSINQTLARTVLTSLTTFVVVAVLFFFNINMESPIEGIAFTLMVGIVVGTYSSIFIASPVVVWLHAREQTKLPKNRA